MSKRIDSTPKADGFRMPGEFESHASCWMLWPERTDNWRDGAKPAQSVFAAIAAAISKFEPVTMGVSSRQFQNARNLLPPEVRLVELSYNDSWIRDCGPTFVVDDRGGVRLVDWDFNAWGGLYNGLYFPWDQDALVARKVAEIERVDRYKAPLVLEGGSIAVDGQGTVITTEECLLDPGRNPDLSQAEIEIHLSDYLNVEKVVWLNQGTDPEETNGHVDGICAYVRPAVVLLHWIEDPSHELYPAVQDAYQRLQAASDARGRRFEIHKLPAPNPMYITAQESAGIDAIEGTKPRQAGDVMESTYINFYIANNAVIVPGFGDPNDAVAKDIFQRLFPERQVVMIENCREISLGGGNIHCITQQQPLGNPILTHPPTSG